MNGTTDTGTAGEQRRIIVTVDAQSHLPPTIELAVALAASRQSALHGLFVEDVDLMCVAQLPFTQEVPLFSGQPRSLDNRQLQRSLDKLAIQFQQLLMRRAEHYSLPCSYSTVRGRKHALELGESAQAEFFIVGQPGRDQQRSVHPLRILLLANRTTQLLPALEVILDSNPDRRVELLLLSNDDEDSPALTEELLARHPDIVQTTLTDDQLQPALLSRELRADYVIVDRRLGPGLLGRVLRLATCPVIVVS
jgi:nucleotide-binding universal stress UspA family protein